MKNEYIQFLVSGTRKKWGRFYERIPHEEAIRLSKRLRKIGFETFAIKAEIGYVVRFAIKKEKLAKTKDAKQIWDYLSPTKRKYLRNHFHLTISFDDFWREFDSLLDSTDMIVLRAYFMEHNRRALFTETKENFLYRFLTKRKQTKSKKESCNIRVRTAIKSISAGDTVEFGGWSSKVGNYVFMGAYPTLLQAQISKKSYKRSYPNWACKLKYDKEHKSKWGNDWGLYVIRYGWDREKMEKVI